jgi:phosphocarrier protein
MKTLDVTVMNPNGLHARTCARLVQAASRFRCNVSLSARGRRASARSVVAVMLLAASVGTTVRIQADGPEEEDALREIAALLQNRAAEI